MSSSRPIDKRQIKVPSKLVDSDYDTKSVKNRKNTKNKIMSNGNVTNGGLDLEKKDSVEEMKDSQTVGMEDGTVLYEEGIQSVIENGHWMVNGKPMFVQKWDPSVLGTPLIMDMVTTNMCKIGTGRVGFARVLIEVEAKKGLHNSTDIVCKDRENVVTGKKIVNVQYDWAPPLCSLCYVFRHSDKNCGCRPRTVEEMEEMDKAKASKNEDKDDFVQVNSRKRAENNVRKNGKNDIGKEGTIGNNVMCRPKENANNTQSNEESSKKNNHDPRGSMGEKGSPGNKSNTGWVIQQDIIDSIRKSANKFYVLQDDEEGTGAMRRTYKMKKVMYMNRFLGLLVRWL
ncbi:RNA-directed DNA polymerase, eukaryota, reverse transcriptase zinc-binding domain protein [Tanacetum coccineum]